MLCDKLKKGRNTSNGAKCAKYAFIAQLVERCLGKAEVVGSIPTGSSKTKELLLEFFCFGIYNGGIEKDVPNGVRQKQSSGLFLGRGLPIPTGSSKCATNVAVNRE